MADCDDDERRDRNERAIAAALGAAAGGVMAGSAGAITGAALGPMLEPLIRGVWNELSDSGRRRQQDLLESAIHAGIPIEKMEERIYASERTQLLTGLALGAATRTASEDKVRTLGRSLASGLLANDDAKIDTEQMIIAAIADIEAPQLAMLELLTCWYPCTMELEPYLINGPLDVPDLSHEDWDVRDREWPYPVIAYARPNLLPIAPSLLGTLQRHGLVVQNEYTDEEEDRYLNGRFFRELESVADVEIPQKYRSGDYAFKGRPKVMWPEGQPPLPRWSPTELGEQVYLRFRDAGTKLVDVWSSGPAEQQK